MIAVAAEPPGRLVWSDEFDQGARPDLAKWKFDLGGHGWGNNELQSYTDRTNNARLEHGCLVIEAHREPWTGPDGKARAFTSARLKTQGLAEWTYGRIEARIKVPQGQGIWPAFWMLGTRFAGDGWPKCGEIDIMENIGREPTTVHGTVHGPGYAGGESIGQSFELPGAGRFSDDFHLFAVDWRPGALTWSVDGTNYFTLTPEKLPQGKEWVFDRPHFLLLNLAVGGNWPGAPDATTIFPQRMLVDYVRVYAPADRRSE